MRNTRTADEKFNIIMESLKSNISIAELCRKHGIAVQLFYKWRGEFYEGAKNRLSGNNSGMTLEKENDELRKIIGDQIVVIETFKKNLTGRRK